jgi:putative nucleotidyltransferase with HDIG domain
VSDVTQTEQEPVSVLLVDDEENILRALQRLLMDEENIEITVATSGEEGLKLIPGLSNLGLIVSDQRMPGMDGALFLEKSREINPDPSRIILTGYADVTAAVDAINKGGAWRYLSKPWNDEELVRVIREGLERYRIFIENRRLNTLVLKQNKELEEWTQNLKDRVLQQTTAIRKKSEELQAVLERIKEDYHDLISVLSGFMEMRGEDVLLHAQMVAELTLNVARELGVSGDDLENIHTAALLHDVGETGISDRILMQLPENMSHDDFVVFSQHPIRGQMAIINIQGLRTVGTLIRHHHENFDGSGYPDHLAGEAIPLGARIIAFADKFERIARNLSGDIAATALARVEPILGKQLDPSLMRAFRKVAKYSYYNDSSDGNKSTSVNVLELQPDQLKEGMKLTRSLVSGTGMLLLYRGMVLDTKKIQAIRSYYELDPPKRGIFVMTK